MDLSRREALQRLAVLAGGVLSAPTVSALLAGHRATPQDPAWTPRALTPQQADLLGIIVDRIIPATDTPGAREVGVPAFIDTLLDAWVEHDVRERFEDGLAGVDAASVEASGVPFAEASAEQQHALLTRLDAEALAARGAPGGAAPFFATLKEWTLVGYYTSEIGATQELQWLAMPGRYDGDLPLEEVGRTWA